jgi:hypothetical protein
MKKYFLLSVIILLSMNGKSYGFDIKSLQPVDPYGVFSTFSAESLPKGKAAVSAGTELSVDPDFYSLIFKTAYGITDTIELDMTVPYVFGSDTVGDGFEDVAFGIKHRFLDENKYGLSMGYILTGSVPSGRDELSTEGRYGIGLLMSKRVGPVNGHLNFFYAEPGTKRLRNEASLLAGLDFAASHNFKLLSELICKKSHFANKIDNVEVRFGYRIKTTDYIYTSFGAGFDLKNRNPETRLIFTVTFLTHSEKKKIKKIYEEE